VAFRGDFLIGVPILYKLYYMPGAASFVVHWLLVESGANFEAVRLDGEQGEHKTPEYLRLNPNGMVPLLLVEGRPVYEAAAIALLLAERHPDRGWAPAHGASAREIYLQWMLHLANTVQPAFRRWFYPHEPAGNDQADGVQARARVDLEAAFERLNAHLAAHGPYVCGAVGPTVVDFHAVMLARWSRHLPKTALQWPAIAHLVQLMTARPSFANVCAEEDIGSWP
jgi:glutathione S-transferase